MKHRVEAPLLEGVAVLVRRQVLDRPTDADQRLLERSAGGARRAGFALRRASAQQFGDAGRARDLEQQHRIVGDQPQKAR